MLTYVSRFLSGDLEPFWPHVTLLSLAVLASIAVGGGIIFERPKYPPSVHRVAFWLVVGGIAVEAVCTIFLFVFDEGISNSQQAKIIALETQIAPRSLSDDDQVRISESLKPFSGLTVWVIAYPTDVEGKLFAEKLVSVFRKAGITTPYNVHSCGNRPEINTPWQQIVTGVYISSGDRPPLASSFGPKLVSLLKDAGIDTQGGHLVHCNMAFGEVEVFVGMKPIPGAMPYDDSKQ